MPTIPLITGAYDPAETQAIINNLIVEMNTAIAGIAGVIDFGTLPSGAAPDGTEPVPALQNAIVVALTVDQLRTSASGINPGDNGVTMSFDAGDGLTTGYGGGIYLNAGAGGNAGGGGRAGVYGGYGYAGGGRGYLKGGGGYYLGGETIVAGGYAASNIGTGGQLYLYGGPAYSGTGGNLKLSAGNGSPSGHVLIANVPSIDPSITGAVWRDSVTGAAFISP